MKVYALMLSLFSAFFHEYRPHAPEFCFVLPHVCHKLKVGQNSMDKWNNDFKSSGAKKRRRRRRKDLKSPSGEMKNIPQSL